MPNKTKNLTQKRPPCGLNKASIAVKQEPILFIASEDSGTISEYSTRDQDCKAELDKSS